MQMEKIKDPAMVLSVVNSVGLVGVTAYFFKQVESIKADMIKINQNFSTVLRKVSEIDKKDQDKGESIHVLNDQIKKLNEEISYLPSLDAFEHIEEDLTDIMDELEQHDIYIEKPVKNYSRRTNDNRDNRRNGDRRYSKKESQNRKPQQREVDSRPGRSRSRAPRPSNDPTSFEDDQDLIDSVRNQQEISGTVR